MAGTLDVLIDEAEMQQRAERAGREPRIAALTEEQRISNQHGMGRELFGALRKNVMSAEEGAVTWL